MSAPGERVEVPDAETLRALRVCINITASVLERAPVDHAVRKMLPVLPRLSTWLDEFGSFARNHDDSDLPSLDDQIGTVEAATLLGCTPRRIQQLATDLDALKINGRYIFQRNTIITYKEAKIA